MNSKYSQLVEETIQREKKDLHRIVRMKTDVLPDIHDIWTDLKRRVNAIKVDYSKRLNETRATLFLILSTDDLSVVAT